MALKQVIVMRKDLNMRAGKMVAQGAHASMKAVIEHRSDERVRDWLADKFTKICVRVESEQELTEIHRAAQDAGLISSIILDAGLTEFDGVPTLTCCAIGPDQAEKIDFITGHLKLL